MATTTDLILLQYLEILEKTNQQLGLWTNPYGVMVTVLSFIIAVLAVVFAFYLWKQSKDYQEKFDSFLKKLQNNFDVEIKKNLKLRSKQNKQLEKIMSEKKKEMEDLTGEAKNKVEKEVKEIQEIKKTLNRQSIVPLSSVGEYGDRFYGEDINIRSSCGLEPIIGSSLNTSCVKKCEKCGNIYLDPSTNCGPGIALVSLETKESKCPYCGNLN